MFLPSNMLNIDRHDRMYVMHDYSFLPTSLHMTTLQYVGTLDHFPICLEVCSHAIDIYKSLLGKPPLRFNSSLLLQPHFDSLMEQMLVNFSKEVNLKGVKAWDITLRNINVDSSSCLFGDL